LTYCLTERRPEQLCQGIGGVLTQGDGQLNVDRAHGSPSMVAEVTVFGFAPQIARLQFDNKS
jgi:hypothetical protein